MKDFYISKVVFLFFLLCVFQPSKAQTTLIDPAGNGGFESGNSFALNGWTATTGTATQNQWVCAAGATAGFSGTQAAYITNNTAGTPPHTYTVNAARASHLYRNVTVPAGETQITLNFSWMGIGELLGSTPYDYMRIWLVPTSYTPTYGTGITTTGSVPTGRVQAGLAQYNNQATWTTASVTIPPAYAGTTFRLVFEWRNDGSDGTNPPAAIDDVSLVSMIPPPLTNNECATATPLTVNPTPTCTTNTSSTTIGATQSQAACTGSGADDDVWFSFTAAGTSHIVTVTPGTLSDAVLQVFSGTCGALTSLACVDATSAAANETTTLTGLTAGATYFIRVFSYASGSGQGTFNICVTTPPAPPANDNCSGAISLTVNPSTTCTTSTAGTSVNATQSQAACSGFGADDDVWYSFTATGTSHIVTVTPGTMSDVVLQIFAGTCGGTLTSLACVDATAGANVETATLSGLTPGTTYFVRVHSYSSGTNQGTFTVCVTTLAPPVNDDCSGATPLTVNAGTTCTSTTSGTSVAATQSQAGCSGTADDDVWFSFVATGATHAVTVTPGTMTDAVLQIFSGTCAGTLTSLACVNATTGTGTETTTLTGLSAGTTYFVRVHSNGNGTGQGTFTVCVTSPPTPPANDNCSGAVALTVNPDGTCTASTAGTTIAATQSQAACSGSGADDDVWYSFVATGPMHTVTVTPGTLSDAVLQVFSGTCGGTLTNLACADATFGSNPESATVAGLVAGATYFVRVHSYASGTGQGTFTVCVTTTTASPNECVGAVELAVSPNLTCTTPTSGTTIGATQSMTGCSGTADDDVWFSFVATGTTHNITVTPGTLYDAVFQVFSGNCGALTSLGCVDNTLGTNSETASISGLTAGNTYYVRVYSYYGAAGNQGSFNICVTTPVPLTNDNCATATSLTVNPTPSCTATTTGTTVTATSSMAGCIGNADDDVWYSFVATSNTHNITITPGTLYDPVFQVFSGGCGALSSLDCVDDTVGFSVESATITGLTVGNTYYVRVYSYFGFAGDQGTFTICINTQTSCTAGSSTGTTDLGCPSVVSGGLGLSGADPEPISCTSGGCVDLEATYLQLGQPTSYTVQSIPYAPPYQFGCLANPVSVNNDDVWSPVINLPFNFCFFGNTYNQCLVSSNGAITFDMANNTPGGWSEWEFEVNLPNNTLFRNAIFGVYHDIDPRVGGEVGWELITLNTGCRALVAAWNNIPMFSTACNSQLYTGMIVLYENTNIIDVYIQEKSVCGSWNDGNALVGIQNANGTLATVAPGRNSLDANWSVTNEAWRFVPSGTSITSLIWYEGTGTSGPVMGTTDVINVCPVATTTYTAEVTYTLCNGTTVKETESTTVNVSLSKVWNGSVNTDWDTAANWTPVGVPTNLDCVVVPDVTNDPVISGSAYDAYAYSLRVLNGGNLTMTSANNLTVTNIVNVNAGGTFNINDDASLLQIDSVANTGFVNMQRTTTPIYRFDYTYWNSPVTLASNYTLGMLSQNLTQYDKYYHWMPSVGGGIGNWAQESAATIMDPTKGYIIRGPNTYSFTPTSFATYTATFTGTPNNGDIQCPITFGSMGPGTTYDKWNLIGNPYPCAVSGWAFTAANDPVINGTLYFWTHNSAISPAFPDPFYGDFVNNYTSSDYAAWNSTGGTAASTGGPAPSGYIGAAQSFFVLSKAVPGNATFTNAMRVKNNNSQFFRPGSANATPAFGDDGPILEKHRVWLNLTNNQNAFSQLLVGYVETATAGYDSAFDGETINQGNVNFYSVIPGHQLVIQGRPLPFDSGDEVPLGYNAVAAGDYAIRIDHFDESFTDHNIYLEDKLLNVVHDLKISPYSFTTDAGQFDTRFVLRYTASSLGSAEFNPQALTAFIKDHVLQVRTSGPIANILVYDVAGKLIRKFNPGENAQSFTADFTYADGVYLARIIYTDGSSANVKLMN